MKRFLGRVCAIIGIITVAFFCLILLGISAARSSKGKIPSKTILEVNLETPVLEDQPDDPFARIGAQDTPVLRDIVEALEKAGSDSRVVGLVARMGAGAMSLAQAQEVRDAIEAF